MAFTSVAKKGVKIDDDTCATKYIFFGTGSSPRFLNVLGEPENKGGGISYCATCDGESYKDKDVVVVGGGNSLMEESLLLLQFVKSITVIHPFDTLQAEKITADKMITIPKVNIIWSHEPRAFEIKDNKMVAVAENLKTKESITVERDGIYLFVGMMPNSNFLKGIFTILQTGLGCDKRENGNQFGRRIRCWRCASKKISTNFHVRWRWNHSCLGDYPENLKFA